MIYYLILFIFLLFFELIYFQVANKLNIIDKPNERSSHNELTIRGGGIIFLISISVFYLNSNFQYTYFFIGLCMVSIVSFVDDMISLPAKFRLILQICSIIILLFELCIPNISFVYFSIMLFGLVLLNFYNFMDGINGITGGYSLLTIISLWYVNNFIIDFVSNDLIYSIIIALCVFTFFNFRIKAKCFAGDIGSVSIAFVILFLLLKLIIQNLQFEYILFLLVYGIDCTLTLIERIIKRQNIFKPHNMHLYQLLVKKDGKKLSHIQVSSIYITIQLIINILTLFNLKEQHLKDSSLIFIFIPILISLYLLIKFKIIKQKFSPNYN